MSYDVKDLYTNCEYYFRVKPFNKVGAGQYLELRTPVITEEVKRESVNQSTNQLINQSINQSIKQASNQP